MATQLERLKAAYINRDWSTFHDVLGEAQNGPPQGESDGSISHTDWSAAKAIYAAMIAWGHASYQFEEELNLPHGSSS